eukprot:scaffold61047_cov38-Phaeocystis_antarctica.AAC.1
MSSDSPPASSASSPPAPSLSLSQPTLSRWSVDRPRGLVEEIEWSAAGSARGAAGSAHVVERRMGDRSSRAPRFVPGFVEGFVEGELEAASMGRCMGGRSIGSAGDATGPASYASMLLRNATHTVMSAAGARDSSPLLLPQAPPASSPAPWFDSAPRKRCVCRECRAAAHGCP